MSNGRGVKRIDVERFVDRLHRRLDDPDGTRETRLNVCMLIELVLCEANRYGGWHPIPQQTGVTYEGKPFMEVLDDSFRRYIIKPTR